MASYTAQREAEAAKVIRARPILFKGEMIRAILSGAKTQTRRVMKDQEQPGERFIRTSPYGQCGDHLWVRETFAVAHARAWNAEKTINPGDPSEAAYYREGFEFYKSSPWRPSIFMPRWASRVDLEITEVRAERLQDISGPDAVAEGIDRGPNQCPCEVCATTSVMCPATAQGCVETYAQLWDAINAKRGHPFSSNPWVWRVEFRRVRP